MCWLIFVLNCLHFLTQSSEPLVAFFRVCQFMRNGAKLRINTTNTMKKLVCPLSVHKYKYPLIFRKSLREKGRKSLVKYNFATHKQLSHNPRFPKLFQEESLHSSLHFNHHRGSEDFSWDTCLYFSKGQIVVSFRISIDRQGQIPAHILKGRHGRYQIWNWARTCTPWREEHGSQNPRPNVWIKPEKSLGPAKCKTVSPTSTAKCAL